MTTDFRSLFLLDKDVVFLNHGSFGACPQPVFEVYQHWQRELERQPVEFLGRRADDLLNAARKRLADNVGADVEDLIFVSNATAGLNIAIRSLPLQPGDEILTTDHEYGALNHTWEFVCKKTGARYVHHPVEVPVSSPEEMVESFWEAVTPRTKVIFISHITSPTALIFPVEEICRRARKAGILTMIDGAHVPGHIALNLTQLGADFYSGNCHKWLCAPKGSAFLHVRREHQPLIEPAVISWGWLEESDFVTRNQWQGTRDLAAFLSVPAAIDFQAEHHWELVRSRCHGLALSTARQLCDLTGLKGLGGHFGQMVAVPLPDCDLAALKTRLYDEYRVEVPLIEWNDRKLIRVSFQAYNSAEDGIRLVEALEKCLPR